MKKQIIVTIGAFFITLLSYAEMNFVAKDKVLSLPGLGLVKDIQFAGYLPVFSKNNSKSVGNLFYWYVENQEQLDTSPLVLWLNGGPGAASTYGFFMENGPYYVSKEKTLKKRDASWTQKADYLVIDQPAGTGLSYGTKGSYANEAQAMDQLYQALHLFFTQHPQLKAKKLYLAGESYAGKYLPQLAMRIIEENHTQKEPMRLTGLLIGDAWVNPKVQQSANADYAYYHGLIDQQDRGEVLRLYDDCAKEIDRATPSTKKANQVCQKIQEYIQKKSGDLNLANIAKGVEPSDQLMTDYLNDPRVLKALHVDPRVTQYNTFSKGVADWLEVGEQDSVADLYPKILAAGIKVLIYNGLEDGKDSNFLSTNLWLSRLSWPYKKEFNTAKRCVWYLGEEVAGYAKTSNKLTQVWIRNAGHLAPIDQPEALLDLLNHFIEEKPLC